MLLCDPEGTARGGLSVALEQLIQAASLAELRLWRLQRIPSNKGFRLISPEQKLEASGSLEALLDRLRPAVLVGVGWHTWSELVVRHAQHRDIPVIFWSHGVGCWVLYRLRPVAGFLRWMIRAPALFGVIQTLRCLDVLVVAYPRRCWWDSRSLDAALASRLDCPIRTIVNPVDTGFWTPDSIGSPAASSQVVSMGRLEWQKGHAQALTILARAQVSSSSAVFVAPEHTPHAIDLLRRARRLGVEAQIEFQIGLDAQARRALLRHSLVYISWSETEYQSLAMLEALACGCVVIARPRGWLCERVIPGVLITKSEQQASIWLRRLIQHRSLARRLGAAGARYVHSHHGLTSVREQWTDLLRELVQQ